MKKVFVTIALAIFVIVSASAQTQSGYVKTKGRLDRQGNVIPGTRLAGAAIELTGGHSTVSDANGNFTLTVPDKKYYLKNVHKKGYVVVDLDALSRQYVLSANPLVITMETREQQLKDQMEVQKELEATLRQQKAEREKELDSLRAANKLSEEEYYNRLQQLLDDKANENLVKEMSKRYAQMDYDLVDSFQRQISALILNGELLKADSLLNTKGNIHKDIEKLNQLRKANTEESRELDARKSRLDSSDLYAQWKQQELLQICTDKVETFRKLNQKDSIAFYLIQKAEIDSTVVGWQLEAGHFLNDTMQNSHQALVYCHRALSGMQQCYGAEHPETASCYQYIGSLYERLEDYCLSLSYYSTALYIMFELYGFRHPSIEMLKTKIDRLSPLCNQ